MLVQTFECVHVFVKTKRHYITHSSLELVEPPPWCGPDDLIMSYPNQKTLHNTYVVCSEQTAWCGPDALQLNSVLISIATVSSHCCPIVH